MDFDRKFLLRLTQVHLVELQSVKLGWYNHQSLCIKHYDNNYNWCNHIHFYEQVIVQNTLMQLPEIQNLHGLCVIVIMIYHH